MNTIIRIIIYGVQGFRRNIWLSIIAIITMTLTVTTITVFALANVVANNKYHEQSERIDYNIFIKDEASQPDVDQFKDLVSARPEVRTSKYLDKEEARKNFEQLFLNDPDFKGLVTADNNPLSREIDVSFQNVEEINSFNDFVNQDRFAQVVLDTSYRKNQNSIANFTRLANLLKVFGTSFTVFFLMIAVLVILNTIRLAIYSRREEVEIMRLVGATRGYVRGPFLVEGILFGLLGSLISAVLIWTFLRQLQVVLSTSYNNQTTNYLTELFGSSFGGITSSSGFNGFFITVLLLQITAGLALGVICSFIAIRRYLKE